MARRPASGTNTQPQAATLSLEQMRRGVERIKRRLDDLAQFDVNTVSREGDPNVDALEKAIEETLSRVFGHGTLEYNRYASASSIEPMSIVWGGPPTPLYETKQKIQRGIERSSITLRQAVRGLEEELNEQSADDNADEASVGLETKAASRKIFVVHGHDGSVRESVARFLERIDFEPVILHEHANMGRTIIEKVEAHSDAGFAVVLLTPDDEGRTKGGELQPRARQNVLLELGYFIGKLGRNRVCALKKDDIEIPSDFAGVVYDIFDQAGAWKQALARELQAAGHEVDWNKVMRL